MGGGIPVVQGLNEGLAANRIQRLYGIVNGTTNYILTRMSEESLRFSAALKAAQAAGFAEADPSFDIDGVDAAHKLAILASLATGGWVKVEDVHREGLTNFDLWDIKFARRRQVAVAKSLALADFNGDEVYARVHTTLIPENHPFATSPKRIQRRRDPWRRGGGRDVLRQRRWGHAVGQRGGVRCDVPGAPSGRAEWRAGCPTSCSKENGN